MSTTNKGWLDGISELLGDVGGLAREAIGVYGDIDSVLNPADTSPSTSAQPASIPGPAQPAYNPNIALSDFAFQPYYPLLIGGAALLIIALMMKK